MYKYIIYVTIRFFFSPDECVIYYVYLYLCTVYSIYTYIIIYNTFLPSIRIYYLVFTYMCIIIYRASVVLCTHNNNNAPSLSLSLSLFLYLSHTHTHAYAFAVAYEDVRVSSETMPMSQEINVKSTLGTERRRYVFIETRGGRR